MTRPAEKHVRRAHGQNYNLCDFHFVQRDCRTYIQTYICIRRQRQPSQTSSRLLKHNASPLSECDIRQTRCTEAPRELRMDRTRLFLFTLLASRFERLENWLLRTCAWMRTVVFAAKANIVGTRFWQSNRYTLVQERKDHLRRQYFLCTGV